MERPRSGGSYRRLEDGTLEQVRAPSVPANQVRSEAPVESNEPAKENDDEDVNDGTV